MPDILFKCPKCSSNLVVEATEAAQTLACGDCGQFVKVPTPTITFRCGKCRAGLCSSDEVAGETFACPNCGTNVVVPPRTTHHVALPPQPATPPAGPAGGQDQPEPTGRQCPKCNAAVAPAAIICVNCGINLLTGKPYGQKPVARPPIPAWLGYGIAALVLAFAAGGWYYWQHQKEQAEQRQKAEAFEKAQHLKAEVEAKAKAEQERKKAEAFEKAQRLKAEVEAKAKAEQERKKAEAEVKRKLAEHQLVTAKQESKQQQTLQPVAPSVGATSEQQRAHPEPQKTLPLSDGRLQIAAADGRIDVVKLLLQQGANVNSVDSGGRTALRCAYEKGSAQMVSYLLTSGADPTVQSQEILITAIDRSDLKMCKMLIGKDAGLINNKDSWNPPLHRALFRLVEYAGSGSVKPEMLRIIELVLESGADPNMRATPSFAQYVMDETPLGFLLREYYDPASYEMYEPETLRRDGRILDAARLLIAQGADPNLMPAPCMPGGPGWWWKGETLLQRAVRGCDESMIRLLVDRGANVNGRNADGNTALHLAAAIPYRLVWGRTGHAMAQPAAAEAGPRKTISQPESPSFGTSSGGQIKRFGTSSGASFDSPSGGQIKRIGTSSGASFDSPLGGQIKRFGTSSGASSDSPASVPAKSDGTSSGTPPRASPYVASLLLKLGADVNATNLVGQTPLHLASDPNLIALLVRAGADVNARDAGGYTALLCALGARWYGPDLGSKGMKVLDPVREQVEALVRLGADVTVSGTDGNTALHWVCGAGWNGGELKDKRSDWPVDKRSDWPVDMIAFLVRHGARVDVKNAKGVTPMEQLQSCNSQKLRKMGQDLAVSK